MANNFSDPEEFIGTDRAIKADPKAAPAPVVKKPGSHSKVAIVGPRKAWEAAALETQAARVELVQATNAFRIAEHAEGDAMSAWMALNRPDPDAVTRAYLKREGEMRLANVKNGLPPNHRGGPVATTNPAPIEQAAINRGRHAGGNSQTAGTPLRSNIARRTV